MSTTQQTMKTMSWVVVPSKFCNLRCAYCYEWKELDSRARMSPELLRRVFEGIRDYHQQMERRFGKTRTVISWLGGEPFTLPMTYLESLMALQREVLGDELMDSGAIHNVVQTNLYRLTDPMIDFILRHRWEVGVSLDVAEGIRVTVNGKATEQAVLANVERLRARGIEPGAIMVLAKHTASSICRIHDFFVENGFKFLRVLPLFSGPAERPSERFQASSAELVDAMCRLFVHWFERGQPIQVEPFPEYMGNALRRMARLGYRLLDRREDGESVLIVNTNGDVYQLLDAYEPERAMGNLGTQDISTILASERSHLALRRDDELKARTCNTCEYAGHCNGWPIFESPRETTSQGRCPIAYPVQRFIERYFQDAGLGAQELAAMLTAMIPEQPDSQMSAA